MNKKFLILLTGMMCDERIWQEQTSSPLLQEKFLFFTPSRKALQESSMEKITQNILYEIPSKNFFLGGISMGGILLMEIYRQASNRILGAIFVNTNHRAETEKRQLQRIQDLNLVKKIGLRRFVIEKMKPNYLAKNTKNKKKINQLVLEMAEGLGIETFKKQSIALKKRRDYSSIIQNIDCPTLILCGDEDRLCPLENHLEMQKFIPNSQLQILKNTGHLSCLENPKEFNKAISNYF